MQDYAFGKTRVKQELITQLGKSKRPFRFSYVSNSPFEESEVSETWPGGLDTAD